jgi:hypothetical protein
MTFSTRRPALYGVMVLLATLVVPPVSAVQGPWPAEPLTDAVNLTGIEGPGSNDFYFDLSGAVWNPSTRTLWICRNGPGSSTSKLWAIVEDGSGGFEVDDDNGLRGEWTGFGDLEAVTQADWDEDVVYLLIEGQERIREYDVSTYGTAVLLNDWDTSPFLPQSGGSGAEGITFVPDAHLAAAGFVDATGSSYTSTGGMGGLMFVGHQNGGGIYVFDLDRNSGSFNFVGEYLTDYSETAALEFDRSVGLLYVWHDSSFDVLSVMDLTSTSVAGMSYRQFNVVESFQGPSHANNEGLAIVSSADCSMGGRDLFMTTDDGGSASLFWYREFSPGCDSIPVFCQGDGSVTPCPCGNTGSSGEGCANSSASGASLVTSGTTSVSTDDLVFSASGLIAGRSALLFCGTLQLGASLPLGDGLRCAGGTLRRLGVQVPSAAGAASWGRGYAAREGWASGETRYFQVWYRDTVGGPCLNGFNLSSGRAVTFSP